MREINRIILHCSASSNPGVTAADVRGWHMARDFNDIGYHFFIRTDGLIEQGRSIDVEGAHCYGYNRTSIGICLNGLRPEDFKEVQFFGLTLVLSYLGEICPRATIHPHLEFEPRKECPVYGVTRFQEYWRDITSSSFCV